MRLGCVANHVNNDAALAFLHERVESTAHIDVSKDLEVPGFAPGRFVHVEQCAARNGTSIVDQNVYVWVVARQPVNIRAVGEIGGDRVDAHVCRPHDGRLPRTKSVGTARYDDNVAAFTCQDFGGGAADP